MPALGGGGYPTVSLAEARDNARKTMAFGDDPAQRKKDAK